MIYLNNSSDVIRIDEALAYWMKIHDDTLLKIATSNPHSSKGKRLYNKKKKSLAIFSTLLEFKTLGYTHTVINDGGARPIRAVDN